MRRAWTRFRSLEDWAQASITCATIAVSFLALVEVIALFTGDRTARALWETVLLLFLVYFLCLAAWGAGYHRKHYRSSLGRKVAAILIAFEAAWLSVQAILAFATAPARRLVRGSRSRRAGASDDQRTRPTSPPEQ